MWLLSERCGSTGRSRKGRGASSKQQRQRQDQLRAEAARPFIVTQSLACAHPLTRSVAMAASRSSLGGKALPLAVLLPSILLVICPFCLFTSIPGVVLNTLEILEGLGKNSQFPHVRVRPFCKDRDYSRSYLFKCTDFLL